MAGKSQDLDAAWMHCFQKKQYKASQKQQLKLQNKQI